MASNLLPEPREEGADPSERLIIGRRLLEQARSELEFGDRVQASEKVWGAAAQGVKAIAHERGWNHGGHRLLFAVVSQLANETGDFDLLDEFNIADSMHNNFYDNNQQSNSIARAADRIEAFLGRLSEVRQQPPRPFEIRTEQDQLLIQRLTDKRYNIGERSGIGFTRPGHWAAGDAGPAP